MILVLPRYGSEEPLKNRLDETPLDEKTFTQFILDRFCSTVFETMALLNVS